MLIRSLTCSAVFASLMLIPGLAQPAQSAPSHGIAMYGEPALPQDFVALPHVNPEAPQGGRIVFGEAGGYDSLNPYIQKGRAPWGIRVHVVESLMGRNWDEPFALYCLLCESVEVPEDRSWVSFTLRPEARFSDGSPVTVEDVIWSIETLGTQGHGRYATAWTKIGAIAQTGPRSLKISFNTVDREMALIMGLRPILRKADWEGRDFTESGLTPITGSGPYVISEFEADRSITFRRNPDYWGRELSFNRGQNNLDEIRYEYFVDASVIFEAFKAGVIDTWREGNAEKWASAYDFPAVTDGRIVKSVVPHRRPTGISGFVFNTRKPMFADWRVREALTMAFSYDFIDLTINGAPQPRITSYFANSVLGADQGPATGKVRALLEPFAADLLPGTMEGYAPPEGDGTERNRRALRGAIALLAEAGWKVGDGGLLRNGEGDAFSFELLLSVGATEDEKIGLIYAEALKRIGVTMTISTIDTAQMKARQTDYDFDMTRYVRGLSLSPGNEQTLYWGSKGRETPGTRNYMGVDSPAIDALIAKMLDARDGADYIAAVHALDRVLTAGRYVIPFWHTPVSRIAHRADLKYPATLPMYGDWLGFLPEVWWQEAD